MASGAGTGTGTGTGKVQAVVIKSIQFEVFGKVQGVFFRKVLSLFSLPPI